MSAAPSGPNRAEMSEYLQGVLAEELALSKSHVSSWGRAAMAAVDMDDAIKLMQASLFAVLNDSVLISSGLQVYQQQSHLGADLNAKTNHVGYGSYMWTPWIHQFLGCADNEIAYAPCHDDLLCAMQGTRACIYA